MRKIIRIEKPPKGSNGLFWVYYKGCSAPVAMAEDSFQLLMQERKLLAKGVSEKELLEYRELVQAVKEREQSDIDSGINL
jgi:hypothetical protein